VVFMVYKKLRGPKPAEGGERSGVTHDLPVT